MSSEEHTNGPSSGGSPAPDDGYPVQALFHLHDKATLTPVVVPASERRIQVVALFSRRFNDVIPAEIFPDCFTRFHLLEQAREPIESSLYLEANVPMIVPLCQISFEGDAHTAAQLEIPLSLGKESGPYFQMTVSGSTRILRLHTEFDQIFVSSRIDKPPHVLTLGPREQRQFTFGPGRSIRTLISGQAYRYWVMLRCTSMEPTPSSILVERNDGSITISTPPETKSARFCALLYASPAARLLGGHRTPSLKSCEVLIVVYPGQWYPARLMAYFTPAAAAGGDLPVARPPQFHVHLTFPRLCFGSDEGWWLPSYDYKILDRSITKLILLDAVPTDQVKHLVELQRYAAITVISPDNKVICGILSELGKTTDLVRTDMPIRIVEGKTRLVLLLTGDVSQSHDAIQATVDEMRMTENEFVDLAKVRAHFACRMSPLPYFQHDLGIGILTIWANVIRGVLPIDDGTGGDAAKVFDYSQLCADHLWIVPWRKEEAVDRNNVMMGILYRSCAEHIACRVFVEAFTTPWDSSDSCGLIDKATSLIEKFFRLWLYGQRSDRNEKGAVLARLQRVIAEESIPAPQVFAQLAENAFEMCSCTKRFDGFDPREEMVSQLNPLVVVVAGGGKDPLDPSLELDAPFWAAYAARISGMKPSAIVPTLVGEDTLMPLKDLQRQLRLSMYDYQSPPDELPETDYLSRAEDINKLRAAFGDALEHTVNSVTFDVIRTMRCDRIVSFSDLVLDYIPWHGSVLGLEFPMSRYPAGGPAYLHVSSALESSVAGFHKHFEHFGAVFYPTREVDEVTKWARETGKALVDTLQFVGGSALIPMEGENSIDVALDGCTNIPIIAFVGHAHATEQWAGLDVGDGLISIDQIRQRKWPGSLVVLIGCETAAVDSHHGNLGAVFLEKGARAVVGTLSRVRVDVAAAFVDRLVAELVDGNPIDYAFFWARRTAAIYEALCCRMQRTEAAAKVADLFQAYSGRGNVLFDKMCERAAVAPDEVVRLATSAMSFTLMGGVSERLL